MAAPIVGSSGWIDAVEPFHVNATRLRENPDLNGLTSVHVSPVAVDAHEADATFVTDLDVSNRLASPADNGRSITLMRTVPIDSIIGTREYALGKLDVEGAEAKAFIGARKALAAENPPVWRVEVIQHLLNKQGNDVSEMWECLSDYDFGLFSYDGLNPNVILKADELARFGNVYAAAAT